MVRIYDQGRTEGGKGDNKKSGRRRYTIKGPQRRQNGENKKSGRRGITIKAPLKEDNDDNNRAGAEDIRSSAHRGMNVGTIKRAAQRIYDQGPTEGGKRRQ